MDRRDFMKKACRAGAGGAFVLAAGAAAQAQTEKPAQTEVPPVEDREKKLSKEWIVSAVIAMSAELEEPETICVLEQCGRACARQGAVGMAAKHKGDLEGFLEGLRGWIGENNARRDGEAVELVYEKCYCHNVRDIETVPPAYCHCSRGWVKEMFETVTGAPCDVELLSSIKRGGTECRFRVRV